MEDSEIPIDGPSNWRPITSKADLAVLGKMGEEVCELGTAICRVIIQGLLEREPTTGKLNKEWLEDEIADVLAMIKFAEDRFVLDKERILARAFSKRAYKRPWFEELAKDDFVTRSGSTL